METEAALAVRMVLAIGLAWLLTFTFGRRLLRLDLRGAGVVGGVCAGFALGPMVLGNLAPGFFEEIAVGGIEPRALLQSHEQQWELDRQALEESDVSEEAVYEAGRHAMYRRSVLRQDLERELFWFRDLPLAIASSLGLVALMLGVIRVRGLSANGIGIGALSAAVAALAWAVLARKLVDVDLKLAAVMGGALAVGSVWNKGSWRMGFGLAGVMVAILAIVAGDAFEASWRAFVAVVLGLIVGRVVNFGIKGEKRSAWVAHGLLVPAVAALMVSSCDLSDAPLGALAFVALAGVLGADLHFVAAYLSLGWLGRGWRHRRPMTAWHSAYAQGFGGTQIVLANLVLAFGLIQSKPEIAGVLGIAAAAMALMGEITRLATHKALAMMRRGSATTHL